MILASMSYCSRFLVRNLTLLRSHILCGKHRFKYNGPLKNIQSKLINCLNNTHIFTMPSHERHGVSSHRQPECLFNNLWRLTSQKKKLVIIEILWRTPPLADTWWRHQMETFSALLAISAGNSPVPGEFPVQRPVTRRFDVFFDVHPNKRLGVHNGEAGDLRRHRAHYDVTVMKFPHTGSVIQKAFPCRDVFMVHDVRSTHYIDVIMTTMASQITSLAVVYSSVHLDADQRKHQSSASLAFVWGIHRDRWIPRTKGQFRGKCFHLMTSSCKFHQASYR